MLRKMSKRLKTSGRSLRSNQQTDKAVSSEISPYFFQKNDHSSETHNNKDGGSTKVRNEIDKEIVSETGLSESIDKLKKLRGKRKRAERNVPLELKYEKVEDVESRGREDKKDFVKKADGKVEDDLENASYWKPCNWRSILENIKEMRKYKTAPVDEMGCHKCADPNASDPIFRYQCLLALMLSSQTRDQVTHAAMKNLISYGCTPSTIVAIPSDILVKLIHPVGFAKKKAEYIKKTSVILLDKYNGDIPKTINELCNLPGVGPKMAHICMQIAWGEVTGIGVDTHVHRICNRLNWVKRPTKTPEDTRKELEDWLPKNFWNEINYLLVGFGQEICLPRFPKCTECLNKDICPFVKKK